MNNSGVYEIRNTVTGHRYIGSSVNMVNRFRNHISYLKRNIHTNPYLQNAWNKYNESAFVFAPIIYCDKNSTIKFEQMCLDTMTHEYNIAKDAAAPNRGRIFPAETRLKIAKASTGRKHTEETKRKIGKAHKGKKLSPETILKHAKAITGFRHTEEARQKMSAAGKGRKFSDDHKAKIGEKTKARWSSKEYRQRLSNSLTGRVFSEEAREKMRVAWKRRRTKSEEVK